MSDGGVSIGDDHVIALRSAGNLCGVERGEQDGCFTSVIRSLPILSSCDVSSQKSCRILSRTEMAVCSTLAGRDTGLLLLFRHLHSAMSEHSHNLMFKALAAVDLLFISQT